MRVITWWDLCDQGSWLPADMSPKPVYEQLNSENRGKFGAIAGNNSQPTVELSKQKNPRFLSCRQAIVAALESEPSGSVAGPG